MDNTPYDKIDPLCIPIVKFFNSIGLTTKFCCQGHEIGETFYIMFDESITDEQIYDFIMKISPGPTTHIHGIISKWTRKVFGVMTSNWEYRISLPDWRANHRVAEYDFKLMRRNYYAKVRV